MPINASRPISKKGRIGELRFLKWVRGSWLCADSRLGDAVVVVDGEEFVIEIKTSQAPKGGTVNQVRPIKYQIVVIHVPNRRKYWIVLPPDIVLQMAVEKDRGQHSAVALENMILHLTGWEKKYACTSRNLRRRVVQAARRSRWPRFDEVRQKLKSIQARLTRLHGAACIKVLCAMKEKKTC